MSYCERGSTLKICLVAMAMVLAGCAGVTTATKGPATPTVPTNVLAKAVNTQINVLWSPSTSSLGISGYLVERCQGAGCSTFAQVASISGTATSYTDGGLASNTVYNYRVRALDVAGNLSPYSNVASATTGGGAAAPVISSGVAAAGTVGAAFSYQITATNSPTSYGATGLPAGLAVNTASGVISGIPTAAGTSTVAVSATNATGTGTGVLALTITAALAAPVVTSSGTAAGTVGAAFSYQITASNSPTSYGATGLPTGLAVNTATGVISGTPTAAGTSTATVSATNATGTGSGTVTITVAVAAPVVTSAGTASGTVGTAFSYQITATNSPTSYGALGLPSGLSVNATSGMISGTPTDAGTSNVTVSASNGTGTGSAALTLTVTVLAPVITSGGTAGGTVGTAFSYQITASNSPTSYGATGLPAGLTANTVTGVISGTPTAAGTSTVTVSATNGAGTGNASLTITIGGSTESAVYHSIQISNDADDGYYNNQNGSGWHSTPESGGADRVGSWNGVMSGWVTGYRFPSVGANSGDTIQSAYLRLLSSDGLATSTACGLAPCPESSYTFRVYGVAQDDGAAFSGTAGNTPLDVPHTEAYTDYTTTGPGDAHGSCNGQNNGQNTCTHFIDVTNIVREITSRPGWTNKSAMRFVMLSSDSSAPNVYAGYEDSSANAGSAATLVVNPSTPTIVSSGASGTGAQVTYPTTYDLGPFVYHGASTLLLFLGDYYNFYGQPIPQPTLTDSCGNHWDILAGPTNWAGYFYYMRSTVYYVQNPKSCPAGATITVTASIEEPIFLHFLAVAGSDTTKTPTVSAITSPSPGVYTTSATSNAVTLTKSGLLVSWIFGDSDAPHVFTPQGGFITDLNSTPNYLTTVFENVSSSGTYQSQFSVSPSDGWQMVIVGLQGL